MEDLENVFNDLHQVDHPTTGCYFTWTNRRNGDLQCQKLDRVVINEEWMNLPSFSKASFEEPDISNHAPALLNLTSQVSLSSKPFKYYNHWSSLLNFINCHMGLVFKF